MLLCWFAVWLEFINNPEKSFGLAGWKGSAGFVHDDDACVLGECLGDLDNLLLGDGELAALDLDRNVNADALKQRPSLLWFVPLGNKADAAGFLSEENVFAYGQIGNKIEFLINDANAGGLRWLRRGDVGRLAIWPRINFRKKFKVYMSKIKISCFKRAN